MASFDDREKGFEAKYKHDQELQFKVIARRNRLLGIWAAEKMGMTGPAAEVYAKDVVSSDFDKPGDDDVIEKVMKDFKAKNIAMTEAELRKQLDRLLPVAKDQMAKQV